MSESLNCSMGVRERLAVGEPVELLFRLSNSTSQPLYVLTWHTPLEGLLNRCLRVTRDGAELAYRGEMMKRGAPVASSYVTLAPGASVEAKVELSQAYDFKVPGKYRIEFPGPLMDVATRKADSGMPSTT
jgi:peptidyl-Lys metalloendopeptidase